MTQPTSYVITTDFSNEEASGVSGRSTVRTAALDAEFSNIAVTVGQIRANLGLIQRDDGHLIDLSVDTYNLTASVLTLIGSAGFNLRASWLTATAYAVKDMVKNSTGTYVCIVAHTSGTFATDLAANKWLVIFDSAVYVASGISFTPTGTIISTNVQSAVAEVSTAWQQKFSDAAAITGAGLIGWARSGANARVRTAETKLRDIVSVADTAGWNGDGVTDDTLAWTNAHGALGTDGGAIFVPAAKSVVSSVTFTKQVMIYGSGMHSGGSQIIAKDATSDVFKFTGSSGIVRDIQFTNAVVRSAGSYILFDTASSRCTVENVYMLGWFRGITIAGVSDFSVRRVMLINGVPTTGVGIIITSGLLVSLADVLVDNAVGSEPGAGIQIPNCGDVTLVDCSFCHCVSGMTIRPGAGQVATSIYASNCFFDNNTTRGLLIAPTSTTGTVQRVRFDGCWFSSSTSSDGITLDTNTVAGTIDGVTFVDPECFLNGASGFTMGGANTKRIKVLGGKFAQNTANGITISSGADNIQIIGATCGPIGGLLGNGAYGIANSAGATDDLIIADCQLTGNTTAAWQGGATGSRRRAHDNNGFVTANAGTSAVANGATTAVVAHGLDVTPLAQDIAITFTGQGSNDYGRWSVGSVGASNFTLTVAADPGVLTLPFAWAANAGVRI